MIDDRNRAPMAKLTEHEVRLIKQQAAKGIRAAELARVYGLAAETVRRILRGETWTWVSIEPPRSEEQIAAEAQSSLERIQAAMQQERKMAEQADGAVEEIAGLSAEAAERLRGYK